MNLEINYDLYDEALCRADEIKSAFYKGKTKAGRYNSAKAKLCGIARENKIKVTEGQLVDTTVYLCRKW